MQQVQMEPHEEAYAVKHGLQVTIQGDRYVVIDLQAERKRKWIGGNLFNLMIEAVAERSGPNTLTNIIAFEPPRLALKAREIKATVVRKPLKALKHGKVYSIKRLVLDNPAISNTEIERQLKEASITASLTTIATVKNDFINSINVLKMAGRYKEKEC